MDARHTVSRTIDVDVTCNAILAVVADGSNQEELGEGDGSPYS